MRQLTGAGAAAILGAVLASASAAGGVPQVLSFQGRLSDAAGDPVADDDYSVAFRIYDQDADGAPLWEETQTVAVADGLCSVLLGTGTSLDLAFDAQYWLAVEVDSDGEMEPRFMLAAAPYAFRAKAADSLGGLAAADFLDKATYDADGDGKVSSAAAADAAGDADTVDGKHAAELADAVHGHDAAYLNATGDAMTGALTLAADPSGPLEAATKQYADAAAAGKGVASVAGVTNDGGDVDLVQGTGITVTPDDPGNQITIAATVGTTSGTVAAGDHAHATYVAKAGDTMAGNLSLGGNEITDVRVEGLAAAPEAAGPANEGRVYYNVTEKRLEYSNGGEWVPVEAGRTVKATAAAVAAANAAAQVTVEFGTDYRMATVFEALALLSARGTAAIGSGTYWAEGADPVGGGSDNEPFSPTWTSYCPYTDLNYYWTIEIQAGGRLLLRARAASETHRVLAVAKE